MAAPYSPCRIQRRLSPTLSHDLYHFRLWKFLRHHLDALRHPVQFYVRPCFDLLAWPRNRCGSGVEFYIEKLFAT
jgi:hypothetical protein